MDELFAGALSSLSGNRLNLYTISSFATASTDKNTGATMINGVSLTNKGGSSYWNVINGNGVITNHIKDIILHDSNNPVEFK